MSSPNKRSPSHAMRAAIVFTASLTVLGMSSTPAFADKRAPAPIIFAGQGARTAPAPQASQPRATPEPSRRERRNAERAARRAPAPQAAARRVEFRYPDQPDTFYGANGVRSDTNAAPLSFSSSTSAISQSEAAKYTVATPQAPANDPAITAGGFDARAAAARVEQAEKPVFVSAAGVADFSSPPVQSAPLPALQVAIAPQQASQAPAAMRPVSGAIFQPVQGAVYDMTGSASVFDPVLNGQPTANGEMLDTEAMIAAHPSLPLPSLVQLINLENNREVVVRVNDRGPIDGSGLIEVSERAANVLGFGQTGTANVRVRYLGPAPHLTGGLVTSGTPSVPDQLQVAAPAPVSEPLFAAPQQVTQPLPFRASDEQFLVQLASFSDISNAQRLYTSLGGRVGKLGIVPVQVGGVDYFRVVAGPLDNRQAAENLRDSLANQGLARGLVIAAS